MPHTTYSEHASVLPEAAVDAMRRTTHAAHQSTNVRPSGLGKQLAGTAKPGQLLSADDPRADTQPHADSQQGADYPAEIEEIPLECPAGCSSDSPARRVSTVSTDPLLSREMFLEPLLSRELVLESSRCAALDGLRTRLAQLCTDVGLGVPPMNAFERWHFLALWDEQSERRNPSDPLIPSCAPVPTHGTQALAHRGTKSDRVGGINRVDRGEVGSAGGGMGSLRMQASPWHMAPRSPPRSHPLRSIRDRPDRRRTAAEWLIKDLGDLISPPRPPISPICRTPLFPTSQNLIRLF